MTDLLVDIGNTRVKWACADDNALFDHHAIAYSSDTLPGLLERHWGALLRPERVYIASVVGSEVTGALCEYVQSTWKLEPQQARAEAERAGLRNAYADPATMGVDRWLALLAAWSKYRQPVCVIDCGTAVTVDVALKDGRHVGGFILPGPALMAAALARETRGIHQHRQPDAQLEFGSSTATCISNGFAFALAGLLERCAAKIREEQDSELLYVVTGGAAGQASALLSGRYMHEPHLVLDGLNLVRRR